MNARQLQDHERNRQSYRKTSALAIVGALAAALVGSQCLGLDHGGVNVVCAGVAWLASVLCLVVAAGGYVVLLRHRRERDGKPDIFAMAYMRQPVDYSKGWRRWIRPILGAALRPGDVVVVRPANEIRRTLVEGRLNGLPFMPEMLAHCGRSFVVDRRIDKINDWPGGNEVRRMQEVVTLVAVRCDGSQHGGCEAGCQVLWHDDWLRRAPGAARSHPDGVAGDAGLAGAAPSFRNELMAVVGTRLMRKGSDVIKYMCQNTELPKASLPMSTWDIRQDLRPLFNGNLGLTGWLIAVLTRVFNRTQSLRGGVQYPVAAPMLASLPTPSADLGLLPGESVRVRNKYDIGQTLHRYFNRGMGFNEETQRHCNQEYSVIRRVTRLIEERSGEMRTMKTPAILLDRATSTGEFLRFVPQNEYVFWREIWLERVDDPPAALALQCSA